MSTENTTIDMEKQVAESKKTLFELLTEDFSEWKRDASGFIHVPTGFRYTEIMTLNGWVIINTMLIDSDQSIAIYQWLLHQQRLEAIRTIQSIRKKLKA